MTDPILQTAFQAIEKKDLPRARTILRDYVARNRQSEQGWLLLSRASGTVENKRICLERVLTLNPHNAIAAKELTALRRSTASTSAPRRATVTPARSAAPVVRPMTQAQPPSHHVATRPVQVRPPRAVSPTLDAKWLFIKGLQVFVLLISLGFFATIAVSVVPFVMGYRTLVITSGSMEPNIPTGAIVIARPVPSSELGTGDVIVFSPNPNATIPVVHRIVDIRIAKGITYYKTQGDANPQADNAEVSLPPTAWMVDYSLPIVGYVIVFATSPIGIAMFIILPMLALALLSLREKLPQLANVLASMKPNL